MSAKNYVNVDTVIIILQPIICIKSLILINNKNWTTQLKLSYSTHDMCMGSNKNKQYIERGLPV